MDAVSLTQKIQASRLLTDVEKNYWSGNLPHMNEGQIAKLVSILAEAENLSWNEGMQDYLSIASKTALPA